MKWYPMTAVAAIRANGIPVLVGDVVLSHEGERVDYAGKIYAMADNLVVGWSGARSTAQVAISRLRAELGPRGAVSRSALMQALGRLGDLRGGRALALTGWLISDDGARVIRWESDFPDGFLPTLSEAENHVGDGGYVLSKMLERPPVRSGNQEGEQLSALEAMSGFVGARFQEMLRPRETPQTWGGAFDLLVLQGGRFRWLPSMTYVIWEVGLDANDRIVQLEQVPRVFKQQRVHDCTVMQTKTLGESTHDTLVSLPVDRAVDPGPYLRRGFSARSPFYANYFQLFRDGSLITALSFVAAQATSAGAVWHEGDEAEPRFQVNVGVLEPYIQNVLQTQRAETRLHDDSPT